MDKRTQANASTDSRTAQPRYAVDPTITVVTLVISFSVIACGLSFIKLADEVFDGETRHFDEWVLRSLRRADDPAVPIGPDWLREAGLDITALGSPAVLVLMVVAVMGLMKIRKKQAEMIMTAATTVSGSVFAFLLKYALGRDRPDVVPHLREVTTPSFPSGHAMISAVVFMTLGILLTRVVPGRTAKIYCLIWAMILTFLVGISRIYLGVHYPTDVLAGWMAGIGWALACWTILRLTGSGRRTRPRSTEEAAA